MKQARFPFPVDSGQAEAVSATPCPVNREILDLQAKLHEANCQLEQSNSECVAMKTELGEAKDKVRKTGTENSVLKRKVASFEEGELLPKPGPSLKPFEELTPRRQIKASDKLQAQVAKTSEERGINPAKLSAFLTYR